MSLGDITSGPGAVFTNSTNPPVTTNEELIRELAKVISDPGSVLPRHYYRPGERETDAQWTARAVLASLPRLGATVDTGPSPAEEAVQSAAALCDLTFEVVGRYVAEPMRSAIAMEVNRCVLPAALGITEADFRAALASPAPAPQGETALERQHRVASRRLSQIPEAYR